MDENDIDLFDTVTDFVFDRQNTKVSTDFAHQNESQWKNDWKEHQHNVAISHVRNYSIDENPWSLSEEILKNTMFINSIQASVQGDPKKTSFDVYSAMSYYTSLEKM